MVVVGADRGSVFSHGDSRAAWFTYVWLTGRGSAWLLVPAVFSLGAFVWLLTLHPAATGKVYATYGAVYIATALAWLWGVDGISPGWRDVVGVTMALRGAAVIASEKAAH